MYYELKDMLKTGKLKTLSGILCLQIPHLARLVDRRRYEHTRTKNGLFKRIDNTRVSGQSPNESIGGKRILHKGVGHSSTSQ